MPKRKYAVTDTELDHWITHGWGFSTDRFLRVLVPLRDAKQRIKELERQLNDSQQRYIALVNKVYGAGGVACICDLGRGFICSHDALRRAALATSEETSGSSMTKLSTKEIIEQRDKAFEALRKLVDPADACPMCGWWTDMSFRHSRSGCIVEKALGEAREEVDA